MKRNELFAAALGAALFTTSAFAEDGWMKRAAVLRTDEGPAGDDVAHMLKGTKVQVLQRDGSFVKIDASGRTGWVAAESVSNREVRPDASLGGSSSAAEMSSGAAIRGVEPIAGDFAHEKHLDPRGLDQMQDIKKSVTSKMLQDFIAAGAIEPPRKHTRTSEAR